MEGITCEHKRFIIYGKRLVITSYCLNMKIPPKYPYYFGTLWQIYLVEAMNKASGEASLMEAMNKASGEAFLVNTLGYCLYYVCFKLP